MSRLLVSLLIGLGLLLSACQAAEPLEVQSSKIEASGVFYTDINVPALQTFLEEKDFTFINVHIPYAGDIPNTDLSIPYDEIGQNLNYLPVDKNAKIVLYCRSGSMSSVAASRLVELGYTNIFNLSGGMVAWEKVGLTIQFE